MFILDVKNSQENDKFVTTVYNKPTFSGVSRAFYCLHIHLACFTS